MPSLDLFSRTGYSLKESHAIFFLQKAGRVCAIGFSFILEGDTTSHSDKVVACPVAQSPPKAVSILRISAMVINRFGERDQS
ncbi:hypothetical protein, partial [Burkholderia sp. BC1]|uniref:hypothetical protein n=1 Tax=Burkholderia sp. BC1 TaxID=1095370 RepID=UPI00404496F7